MSEDRKKDVFDKLHRLPLSRSGDRAPRVPLKVRVSLELPELIHHLEVPSINISRSGILLAVQPSDAKKMTSGMIVNITIDLSLEYFSEQISTPATVVRLVKPDASHSEVWVGLRFS